MKPVCIPCQRFFRPKKTGAPVMEMRPTANDAKPGTAEPHNWAPYKLWLGDHWKCYGCGAQIVAGFGSTPLSEEYHADFEQKVLRYPPVVKVNDC